jgi:hypothetical protein
MERLGQAQSSSPGLEAFHVDDDVVEHCGAAWRPHG